MKIAICLHGLVGNIECSSGKSNVGAEQVLDLSYKHIKKYFLSRYDCDIFIHSWNVESEEKIVKLFKPKSYIIEPQKVFNIPKSSPEKIIKPGSEQINQNCYSKWYSVLESVNLMNKYSNMLVGNKSNNRPNGIRRLMDEDNNIKIIKNIKNGFYDFVLIARFDIAWKKQIKFELLNSKNFYIGGPNKKPSVKVRDFWFIGNQKDISRFSNLYNKIGNICRYKCGNSISNHKIAAQHIIDLNLNVKELLFCAEDFSKNSDYPLIRSEYFNAPR